MTNLKSLREKKGYTQAQLGELSGVNYRVIQHYEQGSKNIDGAKLDTLIRISDALECPLYEILENSDLKERLKKYFDEYTKSC